MSDDPVTRYERAVTSALDEVRAIADPAERVATINRLLEAGRTAQSRLAEVTREVVASYVAEELTLQQIADQLGVTKARAQQLAGRRKAPRRAECGPASAPTGDPTHHPDPRTAQDTRQRPRPSRDRRSSRTPAESRSEPAPARQVRSDDAPAGDRTTAPAPR